MSDSKYKAIFRGIDYPVSNVSKVYFRALTECLRDLGDVDNLSKSAKAIKKIIIPTIGDDVITRGELDEEFYIWHESIEPEEINDLILKVVRCFRLQMIDKAKSQGNEEELKVHEEGLSIVDEYLKDTDTKDAGDDLAEFKKWQKEKNAETVG